MDHGHGQAVPWPRESGRASTSLASGGASAGLSPRGRMKERWSGIGLNIIYTVFIPTMAFIYNINRLYMDIHFEKKGNHCIIIILKDMK